ncbi:hypothetical protein F441_18661 [Phytophthora nicotianae CJ01A1]|uniref:Uncharacterized protein n=2 Tax=Phytophthora nicotianae TaxID=4792 RepID=W2YCH4_PHYNI|nr:hypothetical protein F441_18661 [Phytophthora nicotianae CJ01A1]ETP32725.1 hypothetical protein F442_18620 [Phytophthora nicotianae P10297]
MEVLLRAADERISWNSTTPDAPKYVFLPGIYTTVAPQTAPTQPQHQEDGTHDLTKIAPLKSALSIRSSIAQLPSSPTPVVTDSASEGDGSKIRIILHGDNTFEYVWTMKRSGVRAMEFAVEMEGRWTKPVLNRTRRGQEDQRVILSAQRIRFQRLSNYDTETQTWKLCLRTLTRHGSDWANVGLTERGVPPIVMTFQCLTGCLESTGAALPAQILSNSPACRILAGLTKKIANKLGAPVDVMTEKWLPARGVRLALTEDAGGVKVKQFNPFYCLADTLRSNCQSEPFPSTSA